ncbi:zinc finger protein 91-like [Macrobrachium nipponense]|uniref:zinc finger protein 91-like n=1 Tax=Macrobrachium nipponense TaxID=159736 RepID=UPI0030C7E1E0
MSIGYTMESSAEGTVNSLPKSSEPYMKGVNVKDVANSVTASECVENKEKTHALLQCHSSRSEVNQLHGLVPQQDSSQALHVAFPISEGDFRSATPIQVSLLDGQVIHLTSRPLMNHRKKGRRLSSGERDEEIRSGQTDTEKSMDRTLSFISSSEKTYILPQGISIEGDYLLTEDVLCEDILQPSNVLPEEQILTIPSPSHVELAVGTKPDPLAIAASEVFSNSCISLPLQETRCLSDSVEYQISETSVDAVEEVSCEVVTGSYRPQEAQPSFSDCNGTSSLKSEVQNVEDEKGKVGRTCVSIKQVESGKCRKSRLLKYYVTGDGKSNFPDKSRSRKLYVVSGHSPIKSGQSADMISPQSVVIRERCTKGKDNPSEVVVKEEVVIKEEVVFKRLECLPPVSLERTSTGPISCVETNSAGSQPATTEGVSKVPVSCVETKYAEEGMLFSGTTLRRSPRVPKVKKEFVEDESSFPEEMDGFRKRQPTRGDVKRPLWDCVKCDAMFRTKASRNRHMQEGHLFKCYLCQWQGLTKTSYEIHISTVHCTQKARCLKCRKDFANYKEYKEHMESRHPQVMVDKSNDNDYCSEGSSGMKERVFEEEEEEEEEDSMYMYETDRKDIIRPEWERLQEGKRVCPYCGKKFERHGRFIRHINFHLGNKSFRCKFCEKCFVEKSGLKAHIMTHRPVNEPCPQCGKIFKTHRTLTRHLRTHLNMLYKCALCPKEFRHEESLRVHKKIHQEGGSGNVCGYCGKDCKTPYYLQLHMTNKHEGLKYKCKVCHRSFEWKQSYHKHMVIHNENSDGTVKFTSGVAFRKAHEYKHSQVKKYSCDICGKWFQSGNIRDKHAKTVHQELREHMCPQCGALFKAKSYLDQHLLQVHTTKERVKCQTCGHDFKTEAILKSHIKLVHNTTSGKYACQVCKKTFFAPKDLARHNKVHTGEKNHVCPVCRRCFSRKDNMTSHLRTHSRESVQEQLPSAEGSIEAAKDAPQSSPQESLELLGLSPDGPSSSSVSASSNLQSVSTPSNVMDSVTSLVSSSITFSAVPLPSISLPSSISSSLSNTVVYSNSSPSSACIVLSSKPSSSTLPVVVFSGSAVSNSHMLSHSQPALSSVSLGNIHSNMNDFPISPPSTSLSNLSSVTTLTYCNNSVVPLAPSSSNTLYTGSTHHATSSTPHLSLSSIMPVSSSTHDTCVESVPQETSVFNPALHAEQIVLAEEVLASTSAISSQP